MMTVSEQNQKKTQKRIIRVNVICLFFLQKIGKPNRPAQQQHRKVPVGLAAAVVAALLNLMTIGLAVLRKATTTVAGLAAQKVTRMAEEAEEVGEVAEETQADDNKMVAAVVAADDLEVCIHIFI